MKNNLIIFLLLLLPFMAFSQKEPRQLLRGRIVADSLMVENITVKNITSNISAVTDVKGNFTIYAKVKDTLHFTGIAVRDAMMIVKREHFTEERLLLKLDVNVNVLDEVVINPLTGNLEQDSKNTKTKDKPQFNSGAIVGDLPRRFKYSQNINSALPQTESPLQGINFVKIARMIFKKKKKKPEAPQYYTERTFAEVAQERFTYHFFTETLKIPQDEIGLFLTFCDKGNETMPLLAPQKEFELTDYLVTKSKEYLQAKN